MSQTRQKRSLEKARLTNPLLLADGVDELNAPDTTVFNRYNRWSKRGLWQRILAVAQRGG